MRSYAGLPTNAARALGLERILGSITPRQRADLVLLNAPSHKWIGYSYGDGLVDKVLIRGDVVVEEGRRSFDSTEDAHFASATGTFKTTSTFDGARAALQELADRRSLADASQCPEPRGWKRS